MVKPRPGRFNPGESILFVFLILLTAFILLGSPIFEIHEITVSGNHSLPADKLINLSGITTGTNIFNVKLKEAAGRLRTLPLIKDVRLYRQLPSRVVIQVEERQPVALIPAGNGFVQVDGEGVCLQESSVDGSLPVITGLDPGEAVPGQVVKDERLTIALKVVQQLPASLLPNLSEVHVSREGLVVLYTLGGIECRLGTGDNLPAKISMLIQVLDQVKKQDRPVEYVDLSGVPVVKYQQ